MKAAEDLAIIGAKAAGAMILFAIAVYVLVGVVKELTKGKEDGKQSKKKSEDDESSGAI